MAREQQQRRVCSDKYVETGIQQQGCRFISKDTATSAKAMEVNNTANPSVDENVDERAINNAEEKLVVVKAMGVKEKKEDKEADVMGCVQ